ncbi:hypothetical protein [Brevibacillus sp. HB2.2]|uniref:hypothetical protein n=1 Tax=Brevibacillus sp. HB2.2 TaxID=2738846 RepID=UPI0020C36B8A|nr:hypothetical protein [Brevibacillus sp. HB2.2]
MLISSLSPSKSRMSTAGNSLRKLPKSPGKKREATQQGETIRQFICEHGTANGRLIKPVGGQWLLLSAWLGWYYVKTGRREEAEKIAAWIVSQRQVNGLPEQVQEHLLSPAHYEMWVERTGHPAVPLLWSHAMFLVLAAELGITY